MAMIARTWHGRVPARRADAYADYVRRTGVAALAATPGNRGVSLLRRVEGDVAHFVVTSLWDSMDAIRAFAGADPERARYFPEDDAYLLEREPHVTHHEVLHHEVLHHEVPHHEVPHREVPHHETAPREVDGGAGAAVARA